MEHIQIQDDSGDRRYFTIIPNYILNHSTVYDRDLYIQMKRIAGEGGSCWMSVPRLAKQCGVSERTIQRSMKYLVEHDWIRFVGKKQVGGSGGVQYVNEYIIVDLWKRNIDHYENQKPVEKGGDSYAPPTQRGDSNVKKVVTEKTKGGDCNADKEEPMTKNHIKKNHTVTNVTADKPQEFGNADVNKIMIHFEEMLGLKQPKQQLNRFTAQRLIKRYGADELKRMLSLAMSVQHEEYAPRVASLKDFEDNIGRLKIYLGKKNHKSNQSGVLDLDAMRAAQKGIGN